MNDTSGFSKVDTINLYRPLPRVTSITAARYVKDTTVFYPFQISFPTNDTVTFKFFYSLDGGNSYAPTSNVVFNNLQIRGTANRTTPDSVTWNIAKDLNGYESKSVLFRITPVSKQDSLGAPGRTDSIYVDFKKPLFSGVKGVIAYTDSVRLVWNKAVEGLSNPVSYLVYKSSDSTTFASNPDTTVIDTTVILRSLTDFRPYYFKVVARDSVGNKDTNSVRQSGVPFALASFVRGFTNGPSKASKGSISILYSLHLIPTDTAQLSVLWSADNVQWFPISGSRLSGTYKNISKAQSTDTVIWQSDRDSLFSAPIEDSIKIKIISIGRIKIPDTTCTNRFLLDNRAPRFAGISSDSLADSSGTKVKLAWAPAHDTSVVHYVVYELKPTDTLIAGPTYADSINVSSLTPFTNYKFVVRAVDAVGNVDTTLDIPVNIYTYKKPVITSIRYSIRSSERDNKFFILDSQYKF